MGKLIILDLRPNIYKVGIYKELSKKIICKVLFLSKLGVNKSFYDDNYKTIRNSDTWLLKNCNYCYNFLPEEYKTIFLFWYLFKNKKNGFKYIFIQGYNRKDYILSFVISKILCYKILYRGEGTIKKNESLIRYFQKKLILNIIYFLSHKIFYTCRGNYNYYKHYIGLDILKNISPLTCAVDNSFYQKQKLRDINSVSKIKREKNINPNRKIILFVGQLNDRKQPLNILRSVLHSKFIRDITVVFVGGGPDLGLLKAFSHQNQIDVKYFGFIEQINISKFYNIADLFCIMSKYDNSPKVINEAMNFGIPIIASNACGQAEDLITSDRIGFIVDPNNYLSVRDAIDTILNNDFNYNSELIINKINEFSFSRNAEEIINVL